MPRTDGLAWKAVPANDGEENQAASAAVCEEDWNQVGSGVSIKPHQRTRSDALSLDWNDASGECRRKVPTARSGTGTGQRPRLKYPDTVCCDLPPDQRPDLPSSRLGPMNAIVTQQRRHGRRPRPVRATGERPRSITWALGSSATACPIRCTEDAASARGIENL